MARWSWQQRCETWASDKMLKTHFKRRSLHWPRRQNDCGLRNPYQHGCTERLAEQQGSIRRGNTRRYRLFERLRETCEESELEMDAPTNASESAPTVDDAKHLDEEISKLPINLQSVIVLYHLEEYTQAETAERVGYLSADRSGPAD